MSDKILEVRFSTLINKIGSSEHKTNTSKRTTTITSFQIPESEWEKLDDADRESLCAEKFSELNIVSWSPTVMPIEN